MSVAALAPVSTASGVPLARITVEQYHKMIEAGAFADDDRVELLEGYLVEKMPKNPPHRIALGALDDLLRGGVPQGWHVANQEPVTLDNSEPEPDLTIVRGSKRDYAKRHPGPQDLGLVVEVSDSSLTTDRLKAETYARNQVMVYWIVNLINRCVEVYESPGRRNTEDHYASIKLYQSGEAVPLALDGDLIGEFAVADMLP